VYLLLIAATAFQLRNDAFGIGGVAAASTTGCPATFTNIYMAIKLPLRSAFTMSSGG
jgi:hypothetical protein